MLAGIMQALFVVVTSFIITRVNDIDAAGVFNIAYATAIVLYAIGDYGMRVYQVTDVKRENSFHTYLTAKIMVCLLMVAAGLIAIPVMGFKGDKLFVYACILVFKLVDAISETYQGEFQLSGRLDLGGKSVIVRMFAALAAFALCDILSRDIVTSFVVFAAVNIVFFLCIDLRLISRFAERASANRKQAASLLWLCFPVFFSTLVNLYLINAPKYSINSFLGDAEQGYYAIINLPTFTINLMSLFVVKPMLTPIGKYFSDGDRTSIARVTGKMMVLVLPLTAAVELVCMTIGIPVLEFVFGEKISSYRSDMFLLIISGGFNALTAVLFNVLTAMRGKMGIFISYAAAAVFAFVASDFFVKDRGLEGAGIVAVIIMAVLFAGLLLFYLQALGKMKRDIKAD